MIELAKTAARLAGRHLTQRPVDVQTKDCSVNLVTAIDLASEETLREFFARETPGIPVVGEEKGGAFDASTRWIVDPLDGTTNFVHGFPFYCVSIALEQEGVLSAGVIYDPVRDHLYSAVRGGGAFLGDAPIQVSRRASLGEALVASGFAYDRRERVDWYLAFVRAFLLESRGFRRSGSAAMDLAMVAAGHLDAYWEFGLNPWDVAAGALLVQEAGGRVTDVSGEPLVLNRPRVVASNGAVHDSVLAVVQRVLAEVEAD